MICENIIKFWIVISEKLAVVLCLLTANQIQTKNCIDSPISYVFKFMHGVTLLCPTTAVHDVAQQLLDTKLSSLHSKMHIRPR